MNKTRKVFLKSLETALDLSQACLKLLKEKRHDDALTVLDNRSRVVNIVLHLEEKLRSIPSEQLEPNADYDNLVNRLIKSVNQMDEEIFEALSREKLLTQNEIAKTQKNKENFKGYNLNDLK